MTRIFAFLLFILAGSTAYAAGLSEQDKINGLLDALATSNITFIRNGESHDGAWAKQHLTNKLKDAKDVKTADEFIAKVGSKSSSSNKPYVIKTKDGKEEEASVWFKAKLADFDKSKKADKKDHK
jgi:hypothetical protein